MLLIHTFIALNEDLKKVFCIDGACPSIDSQTNARYKISGLFSQHVFSYRPIVFLRMEFRLTNLSCCERKLQGHQAQDTDLVFETEFVEKLSDELGVPLSELRSFSTRNRCSQLETFKQV